MKLASMAAVIGFACISLSSAFAQTQGPLSRQETNQQSQVTFKPDKFGHSSIIDNTWMPMKPGTRWIYEGTNIEEDGKAVPHRIVIPEFYSSRTQLVEIAPKYGFQRAL